MATSRENFTRQQAGEAVATAGHVYPVSGQHETTTPVLTQLSEAEREALRRFIREERPELGEGQAARVLIREALQHMGLLAVK